MSPPLLYSILRFYIYIYTRLNLPIKSAARFIAGRPNSCKWVILSCFFLPPSRPTHSAPLRPGPRLQGRRPIFCKLSNLSWFLFALPPSRPTNSAPLRPGPRLQGRMPKFCKLVINPILFFFAPQSPNSLGSTSPGAQASR